MHEHWFWFACLNQPITDVDIVIDLYHWELIIYRWTYSDPGKGEQFLGVTYVIRLKN